MWNRIRERGSWAPVCGVGFGLLAVGLFFLLWRPGNAEISPSQATTLSQRGSTATTTPACGQAWRVVTSPDPGISYNYLVEVAAIAADDIWAVGYLRDSVSLPPNRTLIEHWDGNAWSVIPSPNVGSGDNELSGIAAIAADDIWAVGYSHDTSQSPIENLALHWDGSQWSVVSTPNVQAVHNSLRAVDAIAADDVWAIGVSKVDFDPNTPYQTLTMHWDGNAWTIVPSPNLGTRSNHLFGVAAVAANDAWAVGSREGLTLVLHWDGNAWSVVPSPNRDSSTFLYAVSALSANNVWAVGASLLGGRFLTLTMQWDGLQWSVVPSPNVGLTLDELNGIVGVAPDDVWAVGRYNVDFTASTLVEHWDGTQWSVVDSPTLGKGDNFQNSLLGVAALSSGDVWAVGYARYGEDAVTHSLVERYHDPCATPSPTPAVTATPTAPTHTQTPLLTQTATASPTTGLPTSPASTATHTATAGPSPTQCLIEFTDVLPGSTFYSYVRCLACHGIISGYGDGTFRPQNNVTRGQLAKVVSNSAGLDGEPKGQTYEDAPPGHTFYIWIERLTSMGVMTGYPCGGEGEPCDPPDNRPYFRPGAEATRGQIAKIVSNAAGFQEPVTGQSFEDVPPASTFYLWIERLTNRDIVSGYACGGAGEPCVPPDSRPYFRPGNSATRGQAAKIVTQAFLPECEPTRLTISSK